MKKSPDQEEPWLISKPKRYGEHEEQDKNTMSDCVSPGATKSATCSPSPEKKETKKVREPFSHPSIEAGEARELLVITNQNSKGLVDQ